MTTENTGGAPDRPRMRALLDCLAILADLRSYEDAESIVWALERMKDRGDLRALFRPNEAPATTRINLAEVSNGK